MILKRFFTLFLMPLVINGQDPPPAPPSVPPAVAEPSTTPPDSTFWEYLFSPGPETSPAPVTPTPPAENIVQEGENALKGAGDTVAEYANQAYDVTSEYANKALDYTGSVASEYADKALDYTGELAKEATHDVAGMIVSPGTPVSNDQSYLEQAASYINMAPGTSADPNTVFGLYDVLSQLMVPTPEGGVSIKVPTSEMLEKIQPWTEDYFDIGPLITALKGYEAYVKAKDTVGNVKDKVEGAAGDVKDGISNAANQVKDFFGGR